jgi:hypothetical protein
MKKASKPRARFATRATRSRKASTSKKPKRTAKGGRKKQSISGQRQQREKEGARAETGAGVSNIHCDRRAECFEFMMRVKPVSVMRARYALLFEKCSWERKRHHRIRTADSMRWI